MFRTFFIVTVGVITATVGNVHAAGDREAVGRLPDDPQLGVNDGQFAPCPDSPNCISTMAEPADDTHYAAPIQYTGDRAAVHAQLLAWIEATDRVVLVTERQDYIRARAWSRLFGFRDDLELYLPDEPAVVHVRSESRTGYSDMGVNRARYESIRDWLGSR